MTGSVAACTSAVSCTGFNAAPTNLIAGSLLASSQLILGASAEPRQCSIGGDLSCHNSTIVEDTCCFNTPGGLLLLTQFWDADPGTGPADSWTIHGLWPDNCDGSYEQYCDRSREYHNITKILKKQQRTELLDYMSMYWKDYQGDDENLWEHEWNKHGTCISTLETKCYSGYIPQEEVADYFQKSVDLFKGLNTYKILADAGIVPHSSKTYTLGELEDAITGSFGKRVTLNCRNSQLKEVWYFYNVRGSAQTGKYEPTLPGGSPSNCPKRGIKYLPKRNSSPRPTTTGSTPEPSHPAGDAFSGRGYLEVTHEGRSTGCLISSGTWFTTGTCATYTAEKNDDEGFTLTSSKGECGISDGVFRCGSNVEGDSFGAVSGKLSFDGEAKFYADRVPRGNIQIPLYTSPDHDIEVTVSWKAS
ncbi:ribonuclease T2-like [Myotisia sp. PD_48]|nr:ribonuclease T2-like [Myotisia sp. PD_48]